MRIDTIHAIFAGVNPYDSMSFPRYGACTGAMIVLTTQTTAADCISKGCTGTCAFVSWCQSGLPGCGGYHANKCCQYSSTACGTSSDTRNAPGGTWAEYITYRKVGNAHTGSYVLVGSWGDDMGLSCLGVDDGCSGGLLLGK